MGVRTAYNLVSTSILDYIELSPDYSLVEISVPRRWEGQTMKELNLRVRYGINVMAIRHPNGDISVAPQGIDVLESGMCWWPSVPMPTSPSWRIWPTDNGFSRKTKN